MTKYELKPTAEQGQASFYGKAIVIENGQDAVLYSYGIKIMTRKANGEYVRHWNDWSMTTGKHIKAFSGMNKKEYMQLKLV